MGLTRLQPGSCCGCVAVPCDNQFGFTDCVGDPLSGAAFSVTGPTSASGTTDATGVVTLSLLPGTYTVTCTYRGVTLTMAPQTLNCSIIALRKIDFQVTSCGGKPTPGATVAITPGTGLSLSTTSLTTDSTGFATFPYLPFTNYDYTVSYGSRLVQPSGTTSGCSGADCSVEPGYECIACNTYGTPVCDTLHLTDSGTGASITLTYSGSLGSGQWTGTATVSVPAFCGCPGTTAPVSYSWPSNGGADCSKVDVVYWLNSTAPANNCCSVFNCAGPVGGARISGAIATTGTRFDSSSGLLDLTASYSAAHCNTCTFFGVTQPAGVGTCLGTALVGAGTITITDICP